MNKLLLFGIAIVGALLVFGCCCASTPDGNPSSAPSSPAGMAALRQGAQYKVTYASQTTGLAPDVTTYYVKPPNMRVDETMGGTTPISVYILNGKGYACLEDESGMACIDTSSSPETAGLAESLASQINADPIEANQGQFTISQAASRTVLGISTTCFTASSSNGNAQTESCYSPQGVLLYQHTLSTLVDTGEPIETIKQATGYSTSVSDSDFALPAAPQSAE